MKKLAIWLVLTVWCGLAANAPVYTQADEEKAVRGVLQKILDALVERKPLPDLASAFTPEAFKRGEKDFTLPRPPDEFLYSQAVVQKFTLLGSQALVKVYFERRKTAGGEPIIDYGLNYLTFRFVKTENGWKCLGYIGSENYLASDLFAAKTDEERRKRLAEEPPAIDPLQAVIRLSRRFRLAGDYERAEEALKLARWVIEVTNRPLSLPNVINSQGINQAAQGNHQAALRYYLESKVFSEQQPGTRAGVAQALGNIGILYWRQGDADLALYYTQQALEVVQGLDEAKNRITLHSLYNSLGDYYLAQGDIAKALENYQKTTALEAKHRGGPPPFDRLAMVAAKQGRNEEALALFQKAMPNDKEGEAAQTAFIYTQIAEIYLRQGEKEKAVAMAQEVVRLAVKARTPDLIAQAHTLAGRCHDALGQVEPAENEYRQAIGATEKQRNQIVGAETAYAQFFASRVTPYNALLSLLLKRELAKPPAQQNLNEAFVLAEQSKARVLLDALRGARPDASQLMNERERAQDKALREALAEANRRHFAAENAPFKDEKQTAEAKTKVDAARRAYEAWQNQLRVAYPQLTLVNGPARPTLTPDEAARLLLKPNDALLEYFVADDETYLFVFTNAGLRVYTLGLKAQEVKDEVAAFRKTIIPNPGGNLSIGYKLAAQRLFQRLTQPAQTQLAGKTNLLIVPDGELWELPFQALVGPDGRRHLIETTTISYAPSLSAVSEMRSLQNSRQQTARRNLLALGNPTLSSATLAQATTRAGDYGSLPDAETEVRQLGRIFGANSKVLTGAEATENAWKKEAGEYRFLHFATHGQANDRNPLYSRLMLARQTSDAAEEDGLLEAWEVMNVRLNADLAVLSACDTGRGQLSRGEGIMGLSWAFFVGGAPTTVVSHWPVNSPDTAKLMAEFYRRLQPPARHAEVTPAEAFQLAAKKMLANETTNHPYYWAGFSVIGAAR